MIYTPFILIAGMLFLGIPSLNAQNTAPSTHASSTGPSELQSLTADFHTCQKKRMEINKRYLMLVSKQNLLHRKSATTTELETLLTMLHECRFLYEQFESEKFAHISIKSKIDKYIASHDVMPQEMTLISHQLDDLKGYGVVISKDEENLKIITANIDRLLHTIPPPKTFTLLDGTFAFEKIAPRGKKQFYVLTSPITVGQWNNVVKKCGTLPQTFIVNGNENAPLTNITRTDAYAFVAALSRMTGQKIFLPTAVQATILNKLQSEKIADLPVATWLYGVWLDDHRSGGTDLNDRDALNRFGVKMAPIWDPAHRLYSTTIAADNIVGDFAYAKYKALGLILTTTSETAWNCQLNEFLNKIQQTPVTP